MLKASNQTGKSITSNSSNSKSKKTSRDREKRKSHNSVENNLNDKGSPSKDSKQFYAGINSDFIDIYDEHLSQDVRNTLTEDINYRLRHIIHDALIKARLSGRDVINHKDIDETFKNLSIEKIYGASSTPNWVPLAEYNILYLDDAKINLIELAEEENTFVQHGELVLSKQWLPNSKLENVSPALKNYFVTFCHALINTDEEVRCTALRDISVNPQIGQIIEWFYHFGYYLLLKDITYDCLTSNALHLIETLENSPLGSQNVSEKQLNLLVRLLLQRLLISIPNKDLIKPMCATLALLCLRWPLKQMAIAKLTQKVQGIQSNNLLPLLTAIYYLGIEAVREVYLPNIHFFLERICDIGCPDMIHKTQAIYRLICISNIHDAGIHDYFYKTFNYMLIPYWKPICGKNMHDSENHQINFVLMKSRLLKTQRKLKIDFVSKSTKHSVQEVFDLPTNRCRVMDKIEEHNKRMNIQKSEKHITIGKTTLLLSELKQDQSRITVKCCDHSLLRYNI